jgi:Cu/Zn superoxide dismutase
VATGKVIGECLLRHRAKEFLMFLKKINRETLHYLDLHLIVDNYGTHKAPAMLGNGGARRPCKMSPICARLGKAVFQPK